MIELISVLLSIIALATTGSAIFYQWRTIRRLRRSLDWDKQNIELLHDIVRTLSVDNRELKAENAQHKAELTKYRSRGEIILVSGNQVFRVWRN